MREAEKNLTNLGKCWGLCSCDKYVMLGGAWLLVACMKTHFVPVIACVNSRNHRKLVGYIVFFILFIYIYIYIYIYIHTLIAWNNWSNGC